MSFRDKLYVAGRLFITLIFLSAVIGKLSDPQPFLEYIEVVLEFPIHLSQAIFIIIVLLETILGLTILIYVNKSWPLWCTFNLFGFFTIIISYSIYTGTNQDCGCFGSLFESAGISYNSLFRNIMLMGISFILAIDAKKEE